jgi:hypothetical protein
VTVVDTGLEAQLEITQEILDTLEGVTDPASAEAAEPVIEALANRLAEVGAQIRELPKPEPEVLREIAEPHSERTQEMLTQLLKLAEYPELREAFARGTANAE